MFRSRLLPLAGAAVALALAISPYALRPQAAIAADPVSVRATLVGDSYKWNPESVTVPVGTTVTWFADVSPHTVVSTDGGPLSSPLIQPNTSFSFTFNQPGTYNYRCTIHPNQPGTVVVTAAATATPPPPTPTTAAPTPTTAPPTEAPAPPTAAPAPPTATPRPPAVAPQQPAPAAPTPTTPPPAATPEQPAPEPASPYTVIPQRIDGQYKWRPETITVPVGSTVTWQTDVSPHTVTSTDGGPLNSGRIQPNSTFRYTFTEPGVYAYRCTIHPNQPGVVVVEAPAPAASASVPQFGSATSLAWPPVFSGEIAVTVGDSTIIVGLVGNRTLREHAFVDVRWELPTSVQFVDSYANQPQTNRGKLEGLDANTQQVGWINHYVRAGQVQGPFYIILNNSARRAFNTHSWLWFSTADQAFRRNGNYVSSGLRAGGAPIAASAEFGGAFAAAGLPGVGN